MQIGVQDVKTIVQTNHTNPIGALHKCTCEAMERSSKLITRTLDEGEGADVGVDKLLLNDEPYSCKHADTAVSQLRLSPPPDISDWVVAGSSTAQEVKGVKDVGEWLGDSWKLFGDCSMQKHSVTASANP